MKSTKYPKTWNLQNNLAWILYDKYYVLHLTEGVADPVDRS